GSGEVTGEPPGPRAAEGVSASTSDAQPASFAPTGTPQVGAAASGRVESGTPQSGSPVSGASSPAANEADYEKRFEDARQALIDNRDGEALAAFEALADDGASAEVRRVAREFANLARDRVIARQRALPAPHLRTCDEISVLYTAAFTYG